MPTQPAGWEHIENLIKMAKIELPYVLSSGGDTHLILDLTLIEELPEGKPQATT
jgi:hypothetical protein